MLPVSSLPFYVKHPAFLASFSLALLYLTVLSFSGQMITYLISVGYTPLYVGIARTASTIFELSATWVAPRLMRRIGIIRGGIWSLCWQMVCLAGGVSWFFSDFHGQGTNSIAAATGLAVGVALSRIGLWGYDLCAQNIVQDVRQFPSPCCTAVDERPCQTNVASRRSSLTIAAASPWSRLPSRTWLELISYVSTIIFSRPDQFQWPVVISVAAVYASGDLYTILRKEEARPSLSCLRHVWATSNTKSAVEHRALIPIHKPGLPGYDVSPRYWWRCGVRHQRGSGGVRCRSKLPKGYDLYTVRNG